MTEYFSYSSTPNAVLQGPIWPDFNPQSENSQLLIRAKKENDENYWTHMRKVFDHDCDTLPMERYKVWMSTFQVPLMSNSKHSPYIRDALNAPVEHLSALEEPMVGCNQQDFDSFFRVFSDNEMSMNRMQLYGHLTQFKFEPMKYNSILELGAGAGELADIVFKLGYVGDYSIFDFPEIMRVQKYLHEQLGYVASIDYFSEVDQLKPVDLCIATWSLTEMPYELREQILAQIDGTKDWLIAFSNDIFGYDNKKWINDVFLPKFKACDVDLIDIPSMPWDGGTTYLFIRC